MIEGAMTNPEIVLPVKRDKPANDVELPEAKEITNELAIKLYREIQTFNKEVYPELSSFVQKAEENPELNEGELFEAKMKSLIGKISDLSILQSDIYYDLTKDQEIKKYFDHDVKRLAINISFNLDFLVDLQDEASVQIKMKKLKFFSENIPTYCSVFEDVLLRKLEKDPSFSSPVQPVDIGYADNALVNFRKLLINETISYDSFLRVTDPEDKTKRLQPLGEIGSLKGVLSDDEYMDVRSSLVLNSIFNVLRNGCTAFVDAGEGGVNLSVEKQGTDLVIRVVDNGIGLSGNQLDPENEKFIFNEGKQKSERGSTGLGLADLDKRMEKAGGVLRVASRKRGDAVEKMVVYPPIMEDKEKEDFKTTLQTGDNSTIFEWRLPINKKELVA
jgi:hypothetical protein